MSHKFQVSDADLTAAAAWRDQAAGVVVEPSIFDLVDDPRRSVLDGLEVSTVPMVDWATFLDGVDVRTVDVSAAPEVVKRIVAAALDFLLHQQFGYMSRGLFESDADAVHLRTGPIGVERKARLTLTAGERLSRKGQPRLIGRICFCGDPVCQIGEFVNVRA